MKENEVKSNKITNNESNGVSIIKNFQTFFTLLNIHLLEVGVQCVKNNDY